MLGVEDKPSIAYAGRFEPEKRPEVLLKGAGLLREPPQVLLAGQGSREAKLRTLAANASIRFLGPLNRMEMPVFLSAADALVVPSSSEGLPTVALEALACGTPVISTPVGDLPSIVHNGRTGFLFDGTPNALASILREHSEHFSGMRSACASSAKPYGWASLSGRILEVFRAAG